jgi:selenoprotein W-related protein
MTLIPSGGGVFEVTVDGETVFSKKAQKRFPEYGEVKAAIESRKS